MVKLSPSNGDHAFAKIDGKRSKRQSPYLETEIWDHDEIVFIVKYKQYIRKNDHFDAFWALIQETMR